MTLTPPDPPRSRSDEEIAERFTTTAVDGHVTELRCRCGHSVYAENPWQRAARDHVESGECRIEQM